MNQTMNQSTKKRDYTWALSHGARDQVTVSKQPEAGCPDLGLKLADDANPGRPCGAVAEKKILKKKQFRFSIFSKRFFFLSGSASG